jgi:hypothetical protein
VSHIKVTVQCEDCGHRQEVLGSEHDGARYSGSGYDFCDKCEGKPHEVRTGYKLFRRRKKTMSLGPLFINKRLVIEPGVTYHAEDHPTKGYAHRPGWHITESPVAPHLSTKGRVWAEVEYGKHYVHERPKSQGGRWIIATWIRVIGTVEVHRTINPKE